MEGDDQPAHRLGGSGTPVDQSAKKYAYCSREHAASFASRKAGQSRHQSAVAQQFTFYERTAYRAVQPPSIISVSPVISDAAGEARKTTAPATSIGSPMRCSPAIRSTTSARLAGSER